MDAALNAPLHGGPDALGVPLYDFSTNANACGPCPEALAAVRAADYPHYPDPAYTELRAQLAAWHAVVPARIVIAASASEFIHRMSAHAARSGLRRVQLPAHGYGDYARAAQLWGLQAQEQTQDAPGPALHWACEPSSPLGGADAALVRWAAPAGGGRWCVLDCAYAPLRLRPPARAERVCFDPVWQLYTPNKALGLTGLRAAYAIAPVGAQDDAQALSALAPSWPLGAGGVALLSAWTQAPVQAWLARSLPLLRTWKAQQLALCRALGWRPLAGSQANYFTARVPQPHLAARLEQLRAQGIKLRDCASFGLPGHVRLGVLAPPAQQALARAWGQLG